MNTNYSDEIKTKAERFITKYREYAFNPEEVEFFDEETYIAVIRRLTHIVEKGLSMNEYTYGSGKDAFIQLCNVLKSYYLKYGTINKDYKSGLCVLRQYLDKNKGKNEYDVKLETIFNSLEGEANDESGVEEYENLGDKDYEKMTFEELVKSRHSIRHFSDTKVNLEKVYEAIDIASYSPSACNRRGWKSYIVSNELKKTEILKCQNGNKGFGNEIKVIIVITYDLKYCNINRELFHGYIEGGMFALSVLYSLHAKGFASIPLSASLTIEQEDKLRNIIEMGDSEILISIIGIGNYPDKVKVTKSNRINIIKKI
ncbi:nitroreductase family protein [Pseudobutyrivibrio sp. LB2011]|uniref:nitroreductase family protein n=1 Tax=Pseudobutyrivibrio sp. LB2011 TaxID=1408312 RepID=UPI0005D1C9DF|nr:nitroreductase family protein [Pseudobutyrivibrio sp. LB2011]